MKGRPYLFFSATAAAFGGFLFGFDTAVISGAELSVQVVWQLSEIGHTVAVAISFVGIVIGALLCVTLANRIGRKATLCWAGIFCLVSAIGSAMTPEINSFLFFRFFGGLGVGLCCVTVPLYISEIAPSGMKWRLIALFQFNIIFGVIVAYIAIYMFTDMRDHGWRFMLGSEAVPAFLYTVLVFMIPESPRWLIVKKENMEKARVILTRIDPATVDSVIASIQEYRLKSSSSAKSK